MLDNSNSAFKRFRPLSLKSFSLKDSDYGWLTHTGHFRGDSIVVWGSTQTSQAVSYNVSRKSVSLFPESVDTLRVQTGLPVFTIGGFYHFWHIKPVSA